MAGLIVSGTWTLVDLFTILHSPGILVAHRIEPLSEGFFLSLQFRILEFALFVGLAGVAWTTRFAWTTKLYVVVQGPTSRNPLHKDHMYWPRSGFRVFFTPSFRAAR